jgi:stearoyl-CoA desaturase (delta-9 desaturase)
MTKTHGSVYDGEYVGDRGYCAPQGAIELTTLSETVDDSTTEFATSDPAPDVRRSTLNRIITLVGVVLPLIATLAAIVKLWQRDVVASDIALLVGLYLITGFGITIGYHRFATHRGFQTGPVVEFILLALGSMAVEGSVLQWVATHWKHHVHADKPGDPHSPLDGLFHAHIGWMFRDTGGIPERDAKHLLQDRIAVFVSRTFVIWMAIGFVVPYLVDGWRGVLWGGLVRVFVTHHLTWSVNSICHQFGRRSFETPDQSRNEWVVGLFGLGEGWHNNHHAFPESPFHGLRWYEIDLSGYLIRLLERARLIRGLRRVSQQRMERKRAA